MKIQEFIADALALRDKIQAGITIGEHIVKIGKETTIHVPQLINAAGGLSTAITNLQNHEQAIANVIQQNPGAVVKAVADATKAAEVIASGSATLAGGQKLPEATPGNVDQLKEAPADGVIKTPVKESTEQPAPESTEHPAS